MVKYGTSTIIPGTIDTVKPLVQQALKTQGFGILTEIDIQKIMKEKIGADYEPYLILGACNPDLSNRALTADRYFGLLLPCNVVLRQLGDQVDISVIDPEVMFSVVDPAVKESLASLPQDAKARLQAALSALQAQPAI